MKLVERKDLDIKKWQQWCEESDFFSPFSSLAYLDATADNCSFVINAENTGGLAITYKVRFGVKTLYTPVFCRWITWVGSGCPRPNELTEFVQKHFPQAQIYTRNELFTTDAQTLIYQTLTSSQFLPNQQVKRKLKKAEKENFELSWSENFDSVIDVVEAALINKFDNLEEDSFPVLRRLASNFQDEGTLRIVAIKKKEQLVGGLLLIEHPTHVLYLKGACLEEVKLAGGMYLLMNDAIIYTSNRGKTFDFGGSRIDGVRQFNQSFGGVDQNYFYFNWDHGPSWYSFLKKLRNWLKRN